jgi:hypothetical protein
LTGLIYRTLQSELPRSTFPKVRRSILGFEHEYSSYLLFTSGKHLDEIQVRNYSYLVPNYHFPTEPGYSLMVGNGSPIRQIMKTGQSHYHMNANFLACTIGEVFYLQSSSPQQENHTNYLAEVPMIEPIAKWLLPYEIVTMSTHRSHQIATILCRDGCLYTWHNHYGIRKDSLPLLSLTSNLTNDHSWQTTLTMTHHPKIIYLSANHDLCTYDFRSQQLSSAITLDDTIVSIQIHERSPNYYFVSTDQKLIMKDRRYATHNIHELSTKQPFHELTFKSLPSNSGSILAGKLTLLF